MDASVTDLRRGKKVIAVDPITFKVKYRFEYANEAARVLQTSRQSVWWALHHGGICKGFLLFYPTAYEDFIKGVENGPSTDEIMLHAVLPQGSE